MGNVYFNQGDIQKSAELFKEALQLAPNDEDIRYNFELSKLMLEQQPPQQNKDQKQDGEGENKEEQKQKQESEEGNGEEQKQDSEEEQKGGEDSEQQKEPAVEENKEETQSKDPQSKEGVEKQEEDKKQQSQSQTQEEKEKQLDKEEATAILNALKANESNVKPKKYKAARLVKLEKDW